MELVEYGSLVGGKYSGCMYCVYLQFTPCLKHRTSTILFILGWGYTSMEFLYQGHWVMVTRAERVCLLSNLRSANLECLDPQTLCLAHWYIGVLPWGRSDIKVMWSRSQSRKTQMVCPRVDGCYFKHFLLLLRILMQHSASIAFFLKTDYYCYDRHNKNRQFIKKAREAVSNDYKSSCHQYMSYNTSDQSLFPRDEPLTLSSPLYALISLTSTPHIHRLHTQPLLEWSASPH